MAADSAFIPTGSPQAISIRDSITSWQHESERATLESRNGDGSRGRRLRCLGTQAGNGGIRGPGVLKVIPVIAFTLRFP